jgi:hypothetical protein
MEKSVVIDTNVLVDGCNLERPWSINCVKLVLKIDDGELCLGVDNEGEIIEEYVKHLNKFYKKQVVATAILDILRKAAKKNNNNIKSYFMIREDKVIDLMKNGFHKKDIKFVRIAPSTTSKLIISADEKSFLNSEYRLWIENNLKVNVEHPNNYENILLLIDPE